jgi:hypothetical protein
MFKVLLNCTSVTNYYDIIVLGIVFLLDEMTNLPFQLQIVPSSEPNDEKSENRRLEIHQKREERRLQLELKRKEKGDE